MTKPTAIPSVTFTPAELKRAIEEAIQQHEASKAVKAKADSSDKYTTMTISAFKRRGFIDIRPRENVRTFRKWLEAGYIVKTGEKSVPVKGLRLFHQTQVRPLTDEDRQQLKDREEAKAAPSAAKLPVVTPFSPANKAKGKAKPAPQPSA